jgi:hypothetical protein
MRPGERGRCQAILRDRAYTRRAVHQAVLDLGALADGVGFEGACCGEYGQQRGECM